MNAEAVNVAIAKELGFVPVAGDGHTLGMWWSPNENQRLLECSVRIPRFATSLDAMATAEATLTTVERKDYGEELCMIVPSEYGFHLYCKYPWTGSDIFKLATATAAQRAEAFFVRKGKWLNPSPP